MELLKVDGLRTVFHTRKGQIAAVKNISFSIDKGEFVGLVGESGSGKSITSLSIMGLIPTPPGEISEGSIIFKDRNLLDLSGNELAHIRGNEMAMIFQEPMTSLNPVHSIGKQLDEATILHLKLSKKDARKKSIELLDSVGIPRSKEIVREYPHQLSGGMRQRVMIAMAMACDPELLIADEPTTALDVTIQAQILDLMKKLQKDRGLSVLFITHDLGVVAETCERVLVMYAGYIVEEGLIVDLFQSPMHQYTIGLLNSIPKLHENREELESIPGQIPEPHEIGDGCPFASRCPLSDQKCWDEMPPIERIGENNSHSYRCWYPGKENQDD